MNYLRQDFTPRQFMITSNYEYFHYQDQSAMEVEYHNHDFYEIYLFISGKVTYMIEGNFYKLRPGDIVFINNRELHKPIVDPSEAYERIVLWVNPDFIRKEGTAETHLGMCFETTHAPLKKNNLIRPFSDTLINIRSIITKFEKASNNYGYGSDLLKQIYLIELLVFINKAFYETYEQDIAADIVFNDNISQIIHYINQNLDSELTLDAIATSFHCSKYHLIREFKKYTGYTIHQYIQQKRLIVARSLLKTGMQVGDVCGRCGFEDYSNFIRLFKKTFGMPPKKYAKLFSQ